MRSYESINVFAFSSFYCNDLFYTVQAVSRKITPSDLDREPSRLTAKSYPVFEISKIEIKSEECAQEVSSCFICFTQQMKVVINCGKSDILKGKQVVSFNKTIF